MVSSFVRLLKEDYGSRLDPQADKYIGYAIDGAERMQTLIQDLLKLSRVGGRTLELAPVHTGAALHTALDNLSLAIRESGAIVTCDRLPRVLGDESQLTQLWQNLIGNAVKFGPRGEAGPPMVHVGAKQKGALWELSVSDNGRGIDAKHAERIFQVFQRLHDGSHHPGTGIGLAICKNIAERHGGCLWLEAGAGRGATFRFTLRAG